MREQFFQALLESICKATGLPLVVPINDSADWTFEGKRLQITLSADACELRVEGFQAPGEKPIYGTASSTDLTTACFVVERVATLLLAA